MLRELRPEFDLTIEEVDIAGDHELFKKYFDKIPVLEIDHRVTLAAPIHIDAVRAALNNPGDHAGSLLRCPINATTTIANPIGTTPS